MNLENAIHDVEADDPRWSRRFLGGLFGLAAFGALCAGTGAVMLVATALPAYPGALLPELDPDEAVDVVPAPDPRVCSRHLFGNLWVCDGAPHEGDGDQPGNPGGPSTPSTPDTPSETPGGGKCE